jgi:hypothetical protein
LDIEELISIDFSSGCRSILVDDGYLAAASEDGSVKILDLNRLEMEPYTFSTGGKIFAEPALHNGTLYIGNVRDKDMGKGGVCAYTMGGISFEQPEVKLRWDMDLNGNPVQAVLPFDDRIYLNIGYMDGHREIHVIDNIKGSKPKTPKCVYSGVRSSTLAADPPTKRVLFLSEERNQLFINVFEHSNGAAPEMVSIPVKDAPLDFLEHVPIAVLGAKIFAVFGDNTRDLCRLDAHKSSFDTKITGRVRNFALAGMNKQFITNSTGVFSTAGNIQEDLIRGESIVSGPIVLRDKAAVVGMRNGKIRFYKLNALSRQNEFPVFEANDRVQTLAAFKDMIAAGNHKGKVKLLKIIQNK